jgi:two-component system, OmpR family, sensor kinase
VRLPIKARLTLLFALLMAAVLAIGGVFSYHAFAVKLDGVIDGRLTSLASELGSDVEAGETDTLDDFGQGDSQGFFAQVLAGDGQIKEAEGVEDRPLLTPSELAEVNSTGILERSVLGGGGSPTRLARIAVESPAGKRFVVVGTSLKDRNSALWHLSVLLWIASPILTIVTSGLAWLLADAALRPVEQLRSQASLISESDLAKRLPVPQTGDEIATLARTLNDMLARLQQAFERERRFVDDASHELRTPLGILKTELDLALRRSRTKEELEAALLSASEESERLNRVAEDLLVLARADRGRLPLRKERVKAEALLRRISARHRAAAQVRHIRLDVTAPADLEFEVDSVRIEQAVSNLIVNSLAHTPKGGEITVEARSQGGHEVVLAVYDTGSGFPTAFIDKAFDPFTRADAGRSRRGGGAGLGLAIVKGVAEAHGGSARASNRPEGGAVVTMYLPM